MIYGQLLSGFKYALKRSNSSVAYCALSIKCGSRDEAAFLSGIAHFTEHSVFKGTKFKSAGVINNYLERSGGELNAYTTKEEIVFHAIVLKEDFQKAVSLLLELAFFPTFPPKEVQRERGVIIDEINSTKDNPVDEIYDCFEELLFKGHPLSKSILGSVSSVKSIESEDLKKFVTTNFHPNKMAMSLVLNMDEQLMEKKIRQIVENVIKKHSEEGLNLENNIPLPPTPVNINTFDEVVKKGNFEANVVMGALAPSLYSGRERISTILLSNIIGGPSSNSLLNEILREKKGWVYCVDSAYCQYKDAGVLSISFGCDRANLDKCFKEIDRVFTKLKTEFIRPTKLKAAKKQLIGQLAISSDSGETQCLSMIKSLQSFSRVIPFSELKESIEEISCQDIQNLAQQVFDDNNLSKLTFI